MDKHSKHKRDWHPNFIAYIKKISEHSAYEGMPVPVNKKTWVVTTDSPIGKQRKKWWVSKMKKHNIENKPGSLQKIALKTHPFGKKPCQICGKEFYLDYVYPNKRFLKKIKKYNLNINKFDTIDSVINSMSKNNVDLFKQFINEYKLDSKYDDLENIIKEVKEKYKKYYLSPGVMSNAPDRFDGFHSYNLCCRSKEDTGRHRNNLRNYNEDRRAYEVWADGDWKAADDLMAHLRKQNISPDHIGPISLGFCHRPKFNLMTLQENIIKRDRLLLADVKKLLIDEKVEDVVSWHSKFIWNSLKNSVHSNQDAEKVGKLMKKNIYHVFHILCLLKKEGHVEFLEKYMNLKHADYKNKIINVDQVTGRADIKKIFKDVPKHKIIKKRRQRKLLESLDEYCLKENRRKRFWYDVGSDCDYIIKGIKQSKGKAHMNIVLKRLAQYAEEEYKD